MDCPYINWYFGNHPTRFDTALGMLLVVGAKPSSKFYLTRTTKEKGEALTEDNFLWITKESIQKAKQGELAPPRFPQGTRSPKEQAINDQRFAAFIQPSLQWGQARQAKRERRAKLNSDLTLLLSHITDYVVSNGYSELDALNPEILSDKPKLNAARQKAQAIMDELSGETAKREALRILNEQNKAKQAERRLLSSQNRVHTGKRGRPIERWIQVRMAVSDLTPEQKAQHDPPIPLAQDYVRMWNPEKGKMTKRRTVWIMVPNPKAQEYVKAHPHQPSGQKPSDTGPLSMDTHIDNV